MVSRKMLDSHDVSRIIELHAEGDVFGFRSEVDAAIRRITSSTSRRREFLAAVLLQCLDVQTHDDLLDLLTALNSPLGGYNFAFRIPFSNPRDYDRYLERSYPSSQNPVGATPVRVVGAKCPLPPGPECTPVLMYECRTDWDDMQTGLELAMALRKELDDPICPLPQQEAIRRVRSAEEKKISIIKIKLEEILRVCNGSNPQPILPVKNVIFLWPRSDTFGACGVKGREMRTVPTWKNLEQLLRTSSIDFEIRIC